MIIKKVQHSPWVSPGFQSSEYLEFFYISETLPSIITPRAQNGASHASLPSRQMSSDTIVTIKKKEGQNLLELGVKMVLNSKTSLKLYHWD